MKLQGKITNKIGEYPFTLLATVLNNNQEVILCANNSQLKQEIENKGIKKYLWAKVYQTQINKGNYI
jgi:rRNA-processing protein FCF1